MLAYEAVGRTIGTTASWVRKFVGDQPVRLDADTFLRIRATYQATATAGTPKRTKIERRSSRSEGETMQWIRARTRAWMWRRARELREAGRPLPWWLRWWIRARSD
ncbi:hypothetical protein [Methylorubrum extorquens]